MISAKILTALAGVVTTSWHPTAARRHHPRVEKAGAEPESHRRALSVQDGERLVFRTKRFRFWPVMWRGRVQQCHGPLRHGLLRALIWIPFILLPQASLALTINEVIESGEFEIFSTALKKSGLWDRISSEDSVTLFIISDKAMRDEGSAFLLGKVYMTKGSQPLLFNLMSYHVSFATPLLPDQISSEVKLAMSAGACLPVWKSGGGIRIGPEAVVTDVKRVDNGIVYVIDRLLWQPWQDEETCGPLLATER